MEYKFQDQENSEDIFSFGSALKDFICVVFVPNRNIKGSSGPEKIVLSLHKFPAIIFNDDDIEEQTSKFARRANECIVVITEPDYKNLNKNDIEDMYLLIMNGKVPDYAETGLLWSLSIFIRSSVIWERVHDFQPGIERYQ
ncbi:hypothetical protein Tco_1142797 [Tanacetum coccineum]